MLDFIPHFRHHFSTLRLFWLLIDVSLIFGCWTLFFCKYSIYNCFLRKATLSRICQFVHQCLVHFDIVVGSCWSHFSMFVRFGFCKPFDTILSPFGNHSGSMLVQFLEMRWNCGESPLFKCMCSYDIKFQMILNFPSDKDRKLYLIILF